MRKLKHSVLDMTHQMQSELSGALTTMQRCVKLLGNASLDSEQPWRNHTFSSADNDRLLSDLMRIELFLSAIETNLAEVRRGGALMVEFCRSNASKFADRPELAAVSCIERDES